jgi:deoxycytidine triphosphate deaminase
MSASRFAASDSEAESRFLKFRQLDPFPSIEPALLNSADIADYVATTGMVFPFDTDDPKRLKPASYEVAIEGPYVYWDENGAKQSDQLDAGEPFILKANSIVFVTLKPFFRLPDYIAIRFNLRITHIYRGILLGTGPLVDPGFRGKLSVPLHNLTNNDYRIEGGDGLIWMEFTKLSRDPKAPANQAEPQRLGRVYPLEPYKADPEHDVHWYLRRAHNGPIRSSIPLAAEAARKDAAEARDAVKQTKEVADSQRRLITAASIITVVFGLIGALALVVTSYQLVSDANSRIDALTTQVATLEERGTQPQVATPVPRPVAMLEARLRTLQRQQHLDRDGQRVFKGLAVGAVLIVAVGLLLMFGRRQAVPSP